MYETKLQQWEALYLKVEMSGAHCEEALIANFPERYIGVQQHECK
jgi:hypothetical protein